MIGWLRGRLLAHERSGEILVDVGGVGYRVCVPQSQVAVLGGVGALVELYVHTHVREDALVLYGFARPAERRCFELLLGAHGVGPSLALAVLGVLGAEGLSRAVAEEDVEALCAVPGVGRKTAARLVLDLSAKLPAVTGDVPIGVVAAATASQPAPLGDVRAALAELGYGSEEIRRALAGLGDGDAPVEDLLRRALRQLAGAR